MVQAGWKTKIAIAVLAIAAESLQAAGMLQYGSEYVYGVVRPAAEDILDQMSQETYEMLNNLPGNLCWTACNTLYKVYDYLRLLVSSAN